jgi:hypothetical protein
MDLTREDYSVYFLMRKIYVSPSSRLEHNYYGSDQGSVAECSYCEYYNRDSVYDDSDALWMHVYGHWGCGHRRCIDVRYITSVECSTIRPLTGPSFRLKAGDVIRRPLDKYYTPIDPDCLVSWYYAITAWTDWSNGVKGYVIEVNYDDQTYYINGLDGGKKISFVTAYNKCRVPLVVTCIRGRNIKFSFVIECRVSCEKP